MFAVCNHVGGISSGHYTACAKHADGGWFHFNDSHCTPIDASAVISPDNYLLFLRSSSLPPQSLATRQSLS